MRFFIYNKGGVKKNLKQQKFIVKDLVLCPTHDHYEIPNPNHSEALKKVGLGMKKGVRFPLAASAEEIQEILFLTFPKLAVQYNGAVQGFQICKRGRGSVNGVERACVNAPDSDGLDVSY